MAKKGNSQRRGARMLAIYDKQRDRQREVSEDTWNLIKGDKLQTNPKIKRYKLLGDAKDANPAFSEKELLEKISKSYSIEEVVKLQRMSDSDKVQKAAEERVGEIKAEEKANDEDCPSGDC